MRYPIYFLFCLLALTARSQSTHKLHFKAVLVDTHNDVLSSSVLDGLDISTRLNTGQSDFVRWKEGGLDVQFFSVWTGEKARNKEGFYKDAMQEIDSLNIIVLKNPGKITLAFNYHDVKKGIRQEKLVALIGVEGGHMIEDDLGKLEELGRLGMRYMTLTWNNSNSWATSAMDETLHADSLKHKGLTDFGKQVVRKMNELGIIVDLSHTGEQTFYDAIATTNKPVLLSHSSVWNICPVFRNVKDDQIKAVAKNGGVICVNFYSGFISKKFADRDAYLNGPAKIKILDSLWAISHDSAIVKEAAKKYYYAELEKVRPTLSEMVDHIDYIAKMAGVDHVGIGSDFDGIDSWPIGLDDVTTYPKITEELKRRGYSDGDIKKILGENVMRVMKANFRK
jgi:membrane dipeptidase